MEKEQDQKLKENCLNLSNVLEYTSTVVAEDETGIISKPSNSEHPLEETSKVSKCETVESIPSESPCDPTEEDTEVVKNIKRKRRAGLISDDSDDSDTEVSKNEEQSETISKIDTEVSTLTIITSPTEKDTEVVENIIKKKQRAGLISDGSDNEVSKNEEQSETISKIDTELTTSTVTNPTEKDTGVVENIVKRKRGARLILEDSDDSENEVSKDEEQSETIPEIGMEEDTTTLTVTNKKHKRIAILDSDSELEDMAIITPHNKSFNNNQMRSDELTTNSNTSIVPEHEQSVQKSRLATLCDSDSDEELDFDKDNEIIESTQFQEKKKKSVVKPTARKKGNKSKPKDIGDEPKKMTVKQAAEQRKEIQSESQRMLREKDISLPYHKPKSRSLQEFLARRPKLSSAAPLVGQAPPPIAIKMSTEQLEIISKQLKVREKEVKEFYKSASESEGDDNDNEYVPPSNVVESQKEDCADAQVLKDSNNFKVNEELTNHSLEENNEEKDVVLSDDASNKQSTEFIVTADLCEETTENAVILEHENLDLPNVSPVEVSEVAQANDLEPQQEPVQSAMETSTDRPCEISTESYEFHLEDENTEKVDALGSSQEKEGSDKRPEFAYTDLDREIENFGSLQTEETIKDNGPPAPVKSKLELLREQLANDRPRLSGGPDEVIDLDLGVAKPQEVIQLMERFAKHVTAKKQHHPKHKVKLSIVTVESCGDIQKEEVAMNVDSDEESTGVEEKPGAKLHRLREELQKQMEQKKTELWQLKAAKGLRAGPEPTEDAQDGDEYDIDYDEEEEAEMTNEEDTDEEIEDYLDVTDKPREISAFLDAEAEVSENEEEYDVPKEGYEDIVEDDEETEEIEDNQANDSDNVVEDEDSNVSGRSVQLPEDMEKIKVLRRIVKPADDSDDEEDSFNESPFQKSNADVQLDSTVTADEDEIPSHQPRQPQTPIRPAASQAKSIGDFLTPISFITSIQNLASATKAPIVSPFRMPLDVQTPNKLLPQKKLFSESEAVEAQGSQDVSQSQTSSADLESSNRSEVIKESQELEPPSTQDLLGICSGEFTGVTQLDPTVDNTEEPSSTDLVGSQYKSLGQEDMVISQLLDEEELENFKKTFESPRNPVSQRITAEEIIGGQVIDSDDDLEEGQQRKKRKNQKRIQFSDDESSEEEGEEIDLQDNLDNVDYDSEENEIDVNPEGKSDKLKLSDFVEAEAELSESEWGSEDEDENDMDQLEVELGDTEKFDEDQVKSDLEQIHMRRMLDDDTREVKFLQELLLEDGEMHGKGRQRQFKWKNIDLNDDPTEEKKDEDDIYLDEEESEEQWRKRRHEREMFLKQQQVKSQTADPADDLLGTSQLLKIGQKFLRRSASLNSQNNTPAAEKNKQPDPGSPLKNTPFHLQNMRGSFLNRSDQVLERVAEYTKVATEMTANSKKTTKHFLFQTVSATEVSMLSAENKKRKASEGTPNVLKKLRLSANLSPAVKKLDKPERSKKLFNF